MGAEVYGEVRGAHVRGGSARSDTRHFLDGTYCGYRGHHIELDLLPIYHVDEEDLVLVATRARNQRKLLGL